MFRQREAVFLAFISLAFVSACDSPVDASRDEPLSLAIVAGDGQVAKVGTELAQPVVVRVTRENGEAGVRNQLVNFRVLTGNGSMFAGSGLTDAHGFARDYWTIGSMPGENVLEVRTVDPTSGEKIVHGRFTAMGVVPGPEVCNGIDDDLNGTVDDPAWRYCLNAQPAANTDGMNACAADHIDLNAVASDGCEIRAGGRWTFSPAATASCTGILGLALDPVTLEHVDISVRSPTELDVTPTVSVGGLLSFSETLSAPFVPGTAAFEGGGSFSFDVEANGVPVSGNGAVTLRLMFTSPSTAEAFVSLRVAGTGTLPGGIEASAVCDEPGATLMATNNG